MTLARWCKRVGTVDLDGGEGFQWMTTTDGGSCSSRMEIVVRGSRSIDEELCGGRSSPRSGEAAMLRSKSGEERRRYSHRHGQLVMREEKEATGGAF
jgi:hypothetical protein